MAATNYITAADVDALISTETRQALFTAEGGAYDSTQFTRLSELASMTARAAAENAGYSPGESTTLDMMTVTALGAFVQMAFGRKGQDVPEGIKATLAGLLEGVRTGQVPIPDASPSSRYAKGGNRWSTTTGTGARPSVMDALRGIY